MLRLRVEPINLIEGYIDMPKKKEKESWVKKLKKKVRKYFDKEKEKKKEKPEHELDARMRKELKEAGYTDKDVESLMRPKKK